MSSTVNTQTPLEAISCARMTVPSEEGRIIPLSPPPRVRKSRPPQPINPQGQGITIRPGGGPLEENTSYLARGVDLLPGIREEEHVGPPALDTAMERKRAHTTPGNEGKGNASVEVLMANSNSQQRRQHQSRSSQASNPSKFFDSVFRFQVDVQKEERYARRSFSEPAVATLRGRGRGKQKGRLEPGNTGRNSNTMAAELPVLDIRRQDVAPRLELDPDVVKPRPFLSHARTGSSLSSSSRSTVTEESLWPTSTTEDAQISISSTVHSGSSVMSYSNIYGPVEGGNDRTSFIDLSTTTTTTKTTMSNECSPSEGSRARSPKPPIPTTPKPDFGNRSVPSLQQRPPTTNYLKADERADLIRKSRKLAQVFGQTPGAGVMPQQDSWVSFLDLPLGRHLRGTASVSTTPPVWPPPEGTQYLTASGRRHSTPLTPERSSCEYMIQVGSQEGEPSTDDQPKGEDTKSFIDLSEEELPDDVSAIISNSDPMKDRSPSPSLFQFEHLSPEEQAEEIRRRNRDKLAKLHRFLGSRIPADLVLGFEDPSLSLPPPLDVQMESPDERKAWLRRRRSSSVAAFPHWSDDYDRVKEDLNDKEKAINVRRAQKMEKMFGVAPPQTLYHTRHGASPSGSLVGLVAPPKSRSAVPGSTPMASPPSSPKNMNQSPYKLKSRKDDRTGSSESLTHLLGGDEDTSSRTRLRGRSGSLVYTHYQHSLNSLVDIIDRDDRESLAELHEYLNSNGSESPSPPLKEFTLTRDRRTSIASIKSERRRSLPTRTSMTSLASEYSISATLKPEVTDFQLRRRRAAKLTNFFGVDYRDLIRDVLDSIENGLEHERKRGTINPEEAEVLLRKLREIKTKRDGIF